MYPIFWFALRQTAQYLHIDTVPFAPLSHFHTVEAAANSLPGAVGSCLGLLPFQHTPPFSTPYLPTGALTRIPCQCRSPTYTWNISSWVLTPRRSGPWESGPQDLPWIYTAVNTSPSILHQHSVDLQAPGEGSKTTAAVMAHCGAGAADVAPAETALWSHIGPQPVGLAFEVFHIF